MHSGPLPTAWQVPCVHLRKQCPDMQTNFLTSKWAHCSFRRSQSTNNRHDDHHHHKHPNKLGRSFYITNEFSMEFLEIWMSADQCWGVVCKKCCLLHPHALWALVYVLAIPLLIQLLANGLGKTVEHGPSIWVPGTHMGGPKEAPGLWLWPGPAWASEE